MASVNASCKGVIGCIDEQGVERGQLAAHGRGAAKSHAVELQSRSRLLADSVGIGTDWRACVGRMSQAERLCVKSGDHASLSCTVSLP